MNALKNLFKEVGVKNVITLFHAPNNPASMRAHTILKQAAATTQSHATQDQASSHDAQSKAERANFELDVTEAPPTSDQLNIILEYLGPSHANSVVADATGTSDAMRKFSASASSFQRPVSVDWNNSRVVVGDNESELMAMIKALPKSSK